MTYSTEVHIPICEYPSSVAQARNMPIVLKGMVTSPDADTTINLSGPFWLLLPASAFQYFLE